MLCHCIRKTTSPNETRHSWLLRSRSSASVVWRNRMQKELRHGWLKSVLSNLWTASTNVCIWFFFFFFFHGPPRRLARTLHRHYDVVDPESTVWILHSENWSSFRTLLIHILFYFIFCTMSKQQASQASFFFFSWMILVRLVHSGCNTKIKFKRCFFILIIDNWEKKYRGGGN